MMPHKRRRMLALFLTIGWALVLLLWSQIGYLDRSNNQFDSMAESYWVFIVYAGPGFVFPLLLIPFFKGQWPRFIAYLILSPLIYTMAYWITASVSESWTLVLVGGGFGALGIGILHYLTFIRKGHSLFIPVTSVLGVLSFLPAVAIDDDLLFSVCVPLWVLLVGSYVVLETPAAPNQPEKAAED